MKRFIVSPDGKFLVFLGSYGSMHLLSSKVSHIHILYIIQDICQINHGLKVTHFQSDKGVSTCVLCAFVLRCNFSFEKETINLLSE